MYHENLKVLIFMTVLWYMTMLHIDPIKKCTNIYNHQQIIWYKSIKGSTHSGQKLANFISVNAHRS